ncbi:DUF6572 domain-containing protein [Stenotrophomonas oahuensis]|uniref:Uncharacterized protein n=1 Tax=Stenotrophomonas oahuensis TaxID=3003271 RepID=A0ABY9YNJ2_9GAMM|nr:DUF6572 domain-containing protein [Stenotrophomonas sp. A5586]WNH52297.1 hypothetical protein PDM29_18505 [Stenotrophomonas sp. A5586]
MSEFDLDNKHPIPDLGVIDVNSVKKDAGAELHIVIATPLQADERSLERLIRKIEAYLGYIQSDEYSRQCGTPSASTTRIVVDIHPESDRMAFELLSRSRDWVTDNGATLVVAPLDLTPLQ